MIVEISPIAVIIFWLRYLMILDFRLKIKELKNSAINPTDESGGFVSRMLSVKNDC
jgi:hypothetical protein